MNAGFGTGIMCIKQETMKTYPPKIGGFNSYKYLEEQWEYLPSINSYEPGHLNMPGLVVLDDAINFKLELGINNIAEHNKNLMKKMLKAMDSFAIDVSGLGDNENRCNIIGIKGDAQLAKYLVNKGIIAKMRNDTIRIGIHFYNTEGDIDRLINFLKLH